jgi:hypothetical protein
MKKYLASFGLLLFTVALFSLQATGIRSYAANSVAFNNADHSSFRQDTVPRSDTAKHKKWKNKSKGDSSWPKKDKTPH